MDLIGFYLGSVDFCNLQQQQQLSTNSTTTTNSTSNPSARTMAQMFVASVNKGGYNTSYPITSAFVDSPSSGSSSSTWDWWWDWVHWWQGLYIAWQVLVIFASVLIILGYVSLLTFSSILTLFFLRVAALISLIGAAPFLGILF